MHLSLPTCIICGIAALASKAKSTPAYAQHQQRGGSQEQRKLVGNATCPPEEPEAWSDCTDVGKVSCNLGEEYEGDPYCWKDCDGKEWTHLCAGGGGDTPPQPPANPCADASTCDACLARPECGAWARPGGCYTQCRHDPNVPGALNIADGSCYDSDNGGCAAAQTDENNWAICSAQTDNGCEACMNTDKSGGGKCLWLDHGGGMGGSCVPEQGMMCCPVDTCPQADDGTDPTDPPPSDPTCDDIDIAPGESCPVSVSGLKCDVGTEKCCGRSHASMKCECENTWMCMVTEACMMPNPNCLYGDDSKCDASLSSPVVYGCNMDSLLVVKYSGGEVECSAPLTVAQAAIAPTVQIKTADPNALYTVLLIDTSISEAHPILHFGAVNVPGSSLADGVDLTTEALPFKPYALPFKSYAGPNPPSPEMVANMGIPPVDLFHYEWVVAVQDGSADVAILASGMKFDHEAFLAEHTVGSKMTSYFSSGHCVEVVGTETETTTATTTTTTTSSVEGPRATTTSPPDRQTETTTTSSPQGVDTLDDTSAGYYFAATPAVVSAMIGYGAFALLLCFV